MKNANKKIYPHPYWCGSVGWVCSHKLKGHVFDSQSGHMPGCRPGPQLGTCERQPINVSLAH